MYCMCVLYMYCTVYVLDLFQLIKVGVIWFNTEWVRLVKVISVTNSIAVFG